MERVIDTYDAPLAPMQTEDVLAIYRQQVRAEKEDKSERGKMSDAALAKLRALKEQDRTQEIRDARFTSALKLVIVTPENLAKLIERCNVSPVTTQTVRRVQKLAWWITAGFRLGSEIDSVTMVNFFSELVGDEKTMSDTRFASLWNSAAAAKLRASRQSAGLIESTEPEYRACRSGKKCLRFEKRKPAPAKGSSDYCSPACRASDRVRAKRGPATTPTVR
jgi:hypothetical protein